MEVTKTFNIYFYYVFNWVPELFMAYFNGALYIDIIRIYL